MIGDKQLPAVAVAQRKDAIERLADYGIVLPQKAQAYLSVFEGIQSNNIIAAALALGVKLDLLQDERNIRAMIDCMDLVINKHYVPGRDFYAIPFNDKETAGAEADAASSPAPAGNASVGKVLAIVLSYKLYEWNVGEHGKIQKIAYLKQTDPVRDKKEQDEIIAEIIGEGLAVRSSQDRVYQARFIPIINGVPYERMSSFRYGIYLQDGIRPIYKGQPSKYAKPYGIAKASHLRPGSSIAEARAIKAAAREVTNNLYQNDNRTAAEVMALLYNSAAQITSRAEDILRSGDEENMEDAIDLVVNGQDEQFKGTPLDVEVAIQGTNPKAEGKQKAVMSSTPDTPRPLRQSAQGGEGEEQETIVVSSSPLPADIPVGETFTDDGEWTETDQRLSNIARHIKNESVWDLVVDLTRIQQSGKERAQGQQIAFLCDNLRLLMGWTKEEDGFKEGDFKLSALLLMLLVQINTTVNLSAAAAAHLAGILVPSSKNKKWTNENFDTEKSSQARIKIMSIADYVYQEVHGERTGEIPGK